MIETLQRAPFLRLVLYAIAGILFSYHDLFPEFLFKILILLSFVFILVSFIPKIDRFYSFRWFFGFGLFLLVFSFSGLRMRGSWENSDWKDHPEFQTYLVEVIDEPVKKPKTWMCRIRVEKKKAILYISTDSLSATISPGDKLYIKTRFEKPEPNYLQKKGFAARGFVRKNDWEKIDSQEGFNLKYKSLEIRKVILKRLREIIPDNHSFSVAAALITGYKEELDPEVRQTFAATGASHVLAVSGLHFSTIYGILYFLFSFPGNGKRAKIIRQLIILPLMWLFAFMTGLAPSVIRSALMLSLWAVSDTFFLRAFSLNTLSVAAFFMLLFNPLYLLDVGFQLSFSAVASILIVNPLLVGLYRSRNPMINYFWELSCVSTSAQIGTAPFTIYYFNQFPLIYLLTNLFVIPLVGLLLIVIPVSLILAWIFPRWEFLTYPVNQLLSLMLKGLEYFESIPFILLDNLQFSIWDSLFMGLYIVLFCLLLVKKRVIYLYLILIFVVLQVFYYFCLP